MLKRLRERRAERAEAERLYRAVSRRARQPVFHRELKVPDSFDGRFDVLALHAWLLLDVLAARGEGRVGQRFVDVLFTHFDEALRELGAGDIGMSRRMTKMASAFYGRLQAYGHAQGEKALAEALLRNVFRGAADRVESAEALARYCVQVRAHLDRVGLAGDETDFGPEPSARQ